MSRDEFGALPLREPDPELNRITDLVIGALIEVHREIGPGVDEASYEAAVAIEFELRRIPFARQAPVIIMYKGRMVGNGRVDFLVAGRVIVELKAVAALLPIHKAQVITYLRAAKLEIGILANFNVRVMKDGIRRVVLTNEAPL